ncbi:XRE family transcriptional regulator [Desulforegula conservatrix]|uniref:XRE family transcriptional regulator n=1 Tax=Desulforegula conservatrix TaxID=153026 RepID=UPI000428956D|nr:XRE family transcriptional regulator [Desulforegula conservatrix]
MSAIGERLRSIRGDSAQVDFAKKLNIHRNTWVRYETGAVPPDANVIAEVCTKFGINSDWLLFGTGPKEKSSQIQHEPQSSVISCADNTAIDIDNYCFIPMVECRLSGGNGEPVYSEGIKDYYAFRKRFINYIATNAKNLVLMRVSGTSMEPEIKDGGTVMIDMGRKHPKTGCYFALGYGDTLSIKELEVLPAGIVRVISKNRKDYPPYEANLSDIRIIGQVVWGDRMFPI